MGRDLPGQGEWTAAAYLDLVDCGAELDQGTLELKPVTSEFHDFLVRLLMRALEGVVGFRNVHFGRYRIELLPEKFRSPDVIASLSRDGWGHRKATSADLIIEVLSENPSDRQRDFVETRAEYAQAGIPEY